MDQDQCAIALFSPLTQTPNFTLTISVEPKDIGTVSQHYLNTNKILLTAKAYSSQWHFDSWQGDIRGTNNPTELILDSHKSITAYFVKETNKGKEKNTTIPDWANSSNSSHEKSDEPSLNQNQQPNPKIPKWARFD